MKEIEQRNDLKPKKVGIIGGGPAGSFAAYLLAKGNIEVDVFEPRTKALPDGKIPQCTGCGGIVAAASVALLEQENLVIPETVIQSRLTKGASVHLLNETEPIRVRTARTTSALAVYRGHAPVIRNGELVDHSFDAWLLTMAEHQGAQIIEKTVTSIDLTTTKPSITTTDTTEEYDLLIGAFGHNYNLFNRIETPDYAEKLHPPRTQLAAVREFEYFGQNDELSEQIHIFVNPATNVWFAAIVPKGKYYTVILMGKGNINQSRDFKDFFSNQQVKALLGNINPIDNSGIHPCCGCVSSITTRSPKQYMVLTQDDNRIIMVDIGDAGPTRQRKNGLGAALESAHWLVYFLTKYGNTEKTIADYKKFINRNFIWDNRTVDAVLHISDIFLNHLLTRKAITALSVRRVPVLSPFTLSVTEQLVTGTNPYWSIPFHALAESLRHITSGVF